MQFRFKSVKPTTGTSVIPTVGNTNVNHPYRTNHVRSVLHHFYFTYKNNTRVFLQW
jgi:hypothetical protein